MSLIAIIYKAVFLSAAAFLIMLSVSYVLFLYRKKFKTSFPQTLKNEKVFQSNTQKIYPSVHAEYLPSFDNVLQSSQNYRTVQTVQAKHEMRKRAISHRELRKTRYDILNETMKKPALDYSQSNQPQKYFASSTLEYYREKQVG